MCRLEKEGLGNLVLGTAQLGMPYGIANRIGVPDSEQVLDIISASWAAGIRFFDTAQDYGESETALGRVFTKLGICRQAHVLTKISGRQPRGDLSRSIEESLARLSVPKLWGLFLHAEEQLDLWNKGLGAALDDAKRSQLVSHVGVSVYSPERAMQALGTEGVDVIQVPANVFDRRMLRGGIFQKAQEVGKFAFIRSVYLQGLALLDPEDLSEKIPMAAAAVRTFSEFCRNRGLDRRRFALDYMRNIAPSAFIVIGAETADQARENCSMWSQEPLDETLLREWTDRWREDFYPLIDPRSWTPRTSKLS